MAAPRTEMERKLDQIIGLPPLIAADASVGSLYQAFMSAMQAFESPALPKEALERAHTSLTERAKASHQPQALTCLANFNRQYADELGLTVEDNNSEPLSFDHLPDNLQQLFETAEQTLKAFMAAQNDQYALTSANNAYDNLVKAVFAAENDDVDDALDTYQTQYDMNIRVMNAAAQKRKTAASAPKATKK